jgi:hypothetical protein
MGRHGPPIVIGTNTGTCVLQLQEGQCLVHTLGRVHKVWEMGENTPPRCRHKGKVLFQS